MCKITVIMPSLNVASYISQCMDSVINQTLQDLEILAIDAGSTDGTLEILRECEEKDHRIRVVLSEKKSYGYQMNLGISMARGEYIGVVETDDVIVSDMFECLYKKALETEADYVKGSVEALFERNEVESIRMPIQRIFDEDSMYDTVIAPCECPKLFLRDHFLWTGVYRKQFLKEIRLNESLGAAYQDVGFLLQVISSAQRAVYLKKPVYLYRQDNENSSIYNPKGFSYIVGEYTFCAKFLRGKRREWVSAYYQRMLAQCIVRFTYMAASGEYWGQADAEMRELQGRLGRAISEGKLQKEDMVEKAHWEKLQLFLQSPEAVYQQYAKEYECARDAFYSLKKDVEKKEIVIFGSGSWGQFFYGLSHILCIERILAYCDNQKAIQGKRLNGVLVMSPEEAVRKYPDAIFVIANRNAVQEMEAQLLEFGAQKEKIFWYTLGRNLQLFRMKENEMADCEISAITSTKSDM